MLHRQIETRYVDGNLLKIGIRLMFRPVVDKVVVDFVVVLFGSCPLDNQRIVAITGQIDDDRSRRPADIGPKLERSTGFALRPSRVRLDPDLVLSVRFWKKNGIG